MVKLQEMHKLLGRATLAAVVLASSVAILAVADSQKRPKGQDDDDHSTLILGTNPAGLKRGVDNEQGLVSNALRTNAHTLTYYGGPVLSSVHVVKLNYGAGTYQSYVSGTGAGTMSAFFNAITGSPYFTWLNNDYKTPSQAIGYGSFGGDFTITPSAVNNGATITDSQIQVEISAQISSGHIPAPTANTLYMTFFPKGKKISQGGSYSCQGGGFCAYHGTMLRNGSNVYYGVMPDNSTGSGCDSGCGTSSAYNNWTSVASHEMIEAVTDPAVGLASTYGPPLAWYNKTYGEIGDICNAQQAIVTGTDGVGYTVQKEWSNSTNTCRAQ